MKQVTEDSIKKIIKLMMLEAETNSFKQLADSLGFNETTFRSSINNNAIRLRDFVKVADHLGYEVFIKEKSPQQ